MFNQYRPFLAASLALSLLAVGGCTLQPGSFLSLDKAVSPAAQAKASLKVKVERPAAMSTQAIANLAIELRLELPYAADPAHRLQTISLQEGQEAVFSNLPPESGYLTAIFTDIDTNAVVGTQKQNIQLRAGFETHATITFVQGGSAAVDVGIGIGTDFRDYRMLSESDGYDNDYRQGYYGAPWGKEYWLQTPQGTLSVFFSGGWDSEATKSYVTRQIGKDAPERLDVDQDWWYRVPAHATLVESLPTFLVFEKVRHYRWTNTFTVDGTERTLTIDRWYSPVQGLVKETIEDGSGVISNVTLSGV